MAKITRKFKWVALLILPFILSYSLFAEPVFARPAVEQQIKFNERLKPSLNQEKPSKTAATGGVQAAAGPSSKPLSSGSLEEKIREVLEVIEKAQDRSGRFLTPDRGKIKKLEQEIKMLDKQILDEFAATEADLKKKGLSETILKRHTDFVGGSVRQGNEGSLKIGNRR